MQMQLMQHEIVYKSFPNFLLILANAEACFVSTFFMFYIYLFKLCGSFHKKCTINSTVKNRIIIMLILVRSEKRKNPFKNMLPKKWKKTIEKDTQQHWIYVPNPYP